MLKLKKLTIATMGAILSTGLLFGCAADEEDPETEDPATEEPASGEPTEDNTDDGTEEEAPEDGAEDEEGTEG
ncbi:hypothetical protein [Oceanobacillus chungangensis]|uniref:DNA primase n=1 Tax=Oceanobacillus chungangensis TaxID=1229152 RepID=A0A3D8PN20_9BACI|nr:hypothetical protein [Oceanobacillus chungangensis]RDW16631.1 hypothetical protein CWR45_13420 [Oceanobacillus chungangensis]